MNSKLTKGLLYSSLVLMVLPLGTGISVFADDIDNDVKTETVDTKSETEKTIERDYTKEIKIEIDAIKKSNDSSSEKAKKLLDIYSIQVENQRKLANDISILKTKLDDNDLELAKKSESYKKSLKDFEKKEKVLIEKEKEVKQSEDKLKSLKLEIKDATEKIEKKKEVMDERAKNIQVNMSSSNGLIDVILSSESFSDAIGNIVAINKINKADNDLRKSLADDVKNLENLEKEQSKILSLKKTEKKTIEKDFIELKEEKDKLKSEKEKLELEMSILDKQQTEFDESSKEASDKISAISNELSTLSDGMDGLYNELEEIKNKLDKDKNKDEIKEIEDIQKQIRSLQNSSSNTVRSGNSFIVDKKDLTKKQKDIITTAEKYLGVDYVWGGTAVDGMDCSGFTQRVYREAVGVEITRTTYTQQYQGKEVPMSDIQVGDLIFWGEPTYHVAIYAGDGMYIHAPKPFDVIQYSNYDLHGVSHIRRIIDYK